MSNELISIDVVAKEICEFMNAYAAALPEEERAAFYRGSLEGLAAYNGVEIAWTEPK